MARVLRGALACGRWIYAVFHRARNSRKLVVPVSGRALSHPLSCSTTVLMGEKNPSLALSLCGQTPEHWPAPHVIACIHADKDFSRVGLGNVTGTCSKSPDRRADDAIHVASDR